MTQSTSRNKIKTRQLENTTGWTPLNTTFTYATADTPTYTMTATGDLTSTVSVGQKISLQQSQALTSYWSFDTNLNDEVGTNHGTGLGSAASGAGGKFNNGLTLNGLGQLVTITDAANLKPTGEFTIGAWIKTGAKSSEQCIFQSWNYLTSKYYGFLFILSTAGAVSFITANGTGQAVFSNYTYVNGTTDLSSVGGGTWHYIVCTYKNNWGQVYVDGNLEASGYMMTPVYNATNGVKIGARFENATYSSYFGSGGSGTIDDVFFINGYALDEKTIRNKYILGIAQGTSSLTLTKHFITTLNPTYSSGTGLTTITMYGGTDFSLTSGAITNPFYSMLAVPFGFNKNPDKWSVQTWGVVDIIKTFPTAFTTYYADLGSLNITVPKGMWDVSFKTAGYVITSLNSTLTAGLSLANGTAVTFENDLKSIITATQGTNMSNMVVLTNNAIRTYTTSTPLYLLYFVNANGVNITVFAGSFAPTRLRAECKYL